MYRNYGDKNFFERGRLIDTEHSNNEIMVLYCNPYPDEEDLYEFAMLTVDLEDSWINWAEVEPDSDDPAWMALIAVEYYGPENFGAGSSLPFADWTQMNRAEIMKYIDYCLIDHESVSFDVD